jgi:RHS repeat-associated protein
MNRRGQTIDYGYDGIGRLQTIQSPDAQGDPDATVTYSYDAANRVTDVVGPTSSAWYAYNKASQLTRIDRGAADDISFSAAWKGSSSSYDYYLPGDPSQGRLKTISHRWNNKGERKLDFSYNYNTDGLINGMTIDKHIPYVDDNLAVDYQYDSQGRLKDEMGYDLSEAEPRTAVYERHYEYDDAGNRTSMRLVNRDSSDVTWHFLIDDRNRMWGRFVGNDWDDGTKRWWYGYDDNGNLTVAMDQTKENGTWQEGNRWYYTWNTRDEMTRVEKYAYGGNTLVLGEEYRYSLAGSGERTERISYVGNDHYILSWYRYENDGLLTYRVDEKYDADQNDIDEADPWRVREKRTYGPGLVGNLISKEVLEYPSRYSADNVESRVYFYDYDAQGNVALVTEQYCTGSTFKYIFHQDAFGNTLGTQGFHGNGWIDTSDAGITEHQTGKEYNIYTGLYYFNHRWYDPVVGRFISRTGLPPESEGAYVYCENDPVNRVDPDGLLSWEEFKIWALSWLPEGFGKPAQFAQAIAEQNNQLSCCLPDGTGRLRRDRNPLDTYNTLTGECQDKFAQDMAWQLGTAGVARGITLLKPLTRGNFRGNLALVTGKKPWFAQAHHIFARQFEDKFKALGIDIHDPRFGSWWSTLSHQKNAWAYNQAWEDFFSNVRNPTPDQIFEQARIIMRRFGQECPF